MLMTGDRSVFRYWSNTTRSHLDFVDSPMFPWVDMTIGADTGRGAQAKAAIDALRAAFPDPPPLTGLDGLIVLTHPGNRTMPNPQAGNRDNRPTVTTSFDGGTADVAGMPVAVLPVMSSNHTFMCHEVGHVLGFEHSFGVDNNGTDWNPNDANIIVGPEYGVPVRHDVRDVVRQPLARHRAVLLGVSDVRGPGGCRLAQRRRILDGAARRPGESPP